MILNLVSEWLSPRAITFERDRLTVAEGFA